MTVEERAQMKRWVDTSKETGPLLEKLRREELRATDTVQAMQRLAGAFASGHFMQQHTPRPTSGLVRQQELFALWRKSTTMLPSD